MKRLLPFLMSLAVGLSLCGAGEADQVHWSYSVAPNSPNPVPADGGSPKSSILFSGETTVNPQGTTGIVLSGLTAISTAAPGSSDTFTATPWSVNLTITDTPSGLSKVLTIAGTLTGTVNTGSSIIGNNFTTGPTTFTLGSDTYTVTPDSFLGPSVPNANNSGGVGATVSVSTPEPSSMLLCVLGAAGCVLVRRKRRLAAA